MIKPIDCLTVRQLARLAGIPHQRVSDAVKRGDLDVIRVGRCAFIRDTDAAQWLAIRRRS